MGAGLLIWSSGVAALLRCLHHSLLSCIHSTNVHCAPSSRGLGSERTRGSPLPPQCRRHSRGADRLRQTSAKRPCPSASAGTPCWEGGAGPGWGCRCQPGGQDEERAKTGGSGVPGEPGEHPVTSGEQGPSWGTSRAIVGTLVSIARGSEAPPKAEQRRICLTAEWRRHRGVSVGPAGASGWRRPRKPRGRGPGWGVGEALGCPHRREVGAEERVAQDGTECSGRVAGRGRRGDRGSDPGVSTRRPAGA